MDDGSMALLIGLLGTVLGFLLFGAALAGAWILGRARGQRDAASARDRPAVVGPDVVRQIARVEQLVVDLGVEVERISESQRFSARLLAERESKPALPE